MKEKQVKVNQIRRYRDKMDAYLDLDTFIIVEIYGPTNDMCCKLKILGTDEVEIFTVQYIQKYTELISEGW